MLSRPAAIVALLVSGACTESVSTLLPSPRITFAVAWRNPTNVLSAIVAARVSKADSMMLRFHRASDAGGLDSTTPAVPAGHGLTRIPVLGLLADEAYVIRLVAYGGGAEAISAPLEFRTGPLPADLPRYAATGDDPTPGFTAFAAGLYGLVIDNTGRVVWYHKFENGPWLNFMAQPNGRYVARRVTPATNDIETWVEIDPLGNVTRTPGCQGGLQPRFHDLLATAAGDYWILCDETRLMDLTAYGGVASASVTGSVVQHIGASGELLFHWSAFDHFEVTDVDSSFRVGASVNWTHANALDLDADGNLLVSFRNLNEITKIAARSGAVLWRLGGRRNQFAFAAGSVAFEGQHAVRSLPSGELLLLDNVGDAAASRVERWQLDTATRTARMTASYTSQPAVRTLIGGSVQALSGSRTLVSFGTEGRVEEYDSAGRVRWRIEGTPGYVFRAQRFASLYRPGVASPR